MKTLCSSPRPRFRPARHLPFELLQQIKVYLEESLFTQALRSLQSLILADAADADHKRGVFVPPAEYIALLSTLTLHPTFTSRASTQERLGQSNDAFRLLRTINRVVGPVNARLRDAYRYRRYDTGLLGRRGVDDDDGEDEEAGNDHYSINNPLNSPYADAESIFSLAEDFWAVVGWALNCSCLPGGMYAARWNYWCSWLEYMLDVLETDWEMREEEANALSSSLLAQYIESATGGHARGRRILRAVFADGGAASLKEFREVFRKELKEPRGERDNNTTTKKQQQQQVAVDVDQGIYGDWMQEEDSSTDEDDITKRDDLLQTRPAKRLRTRAPRLAAKSLLFNETDDSDASSLINQQQQNDVNPDKPPLGPPSSLTIRLRILQLLSSFSAALSQVTPRRQTTATAAAIASSFPDLHELYTLFVEFIRPLPLSAFERIILPSVSSSIDSSGGVGGDPLRPDSRVALSEFLLQRLSDSASANQRVGTFEPMTQSRLVAEYLPFAAGRNTVEAQAKVAVLLEGLVRLLSSSSSSSGGGEVGTPLRATADLVDAVRAGIARRLAKAAELRDGGAGAGAGAGGGGGATTRHKRANPRDEDAAYRVLVESGARMTFVVEHFIE